MSDITSSESESAEKVILDKKSKKPAHYASKDDVSDDEHSLQDFKEKDAAAYWKSKYFRTGRFQKQKLTTAGLKEKLSSHIKKCKMASKDLAMGKVELMPGSGVRVPKEDVQRFLEET